jgi:predicted small secreted protein
MMKRVLFGLFAAIMLVMGVTGCNTVRGAGEDIEDVGESIDRNL